MGVEGGRPGMGVRNNCLYLLVVDKGRVGNLGVAYVVVEGIGRAGVVDPLGQAHHKNASPNPKGHGTNDHSAAPGTAPDVAPSHGEEQAHRCTGLVLNTVRRGQAAAARVMSTMIPACVNDMDQSKLGGRMASQPCCSMAAATSPQRRKG